MHHGSLHLLLSHASAKPGDVPGLEWQCPRCQRRMRLHSAIALAALAVFFVVVLVAVWLLRRG